VSFVFAQGTNEPVWRKDPSAPAGSEKNPARVSSGVIAGNAIKQPKPVFPATHRDNPDSPRSGTSVMRATISPEGKVERLEWISGWSANQQTVMDAVKQWIYKPYMLNGKAVWVETTVTISVDFGG